MFNVADIVVVAIIALTGFLGYKKGFIKTGLGFLSFFIALAMTFMFYKPVMGMIREKTSFEPWLTEYLYQLDLTGEKNKEINSQENDELDSTGEEYISNLPTTIVELIGLDEIKENAKNMIVQKIVDFAVKLLAIVVVYIVARILLAIIIIVLDLIAKLPLLKQFNESLGLAIGVILGIIRIYAIFMVITLLGSLPFANGIVSTINGSFIASFLYNNNLLLKLLF
ncbi:MAG: CvpA family protein [Clostridia bacterium]|nr:CvpA family protein [Clostridia bacterium]